MVNTKNQELLTSLIQGTDDTVEMEVEGLPEPLTLRPLNSGELRKLQKMEKQGQKGVVKIKKNATREEIQEAVEGEEQNLESNLDYAALTDSIARTKIQAVCWSADVPAALIDGLPHPVPDDLFEKVMEISNFTEEDLDLLKNFRKNK